MSRQGRGEKRERGTRKSERGVTGDLPAIISPFHAALLSFELRFESVLASRWRDLEFGATLGPDTPLGEKRSALDRFFMDAEKAIRSVVHEYFPRLMEVARVQRQHLGKLSPLDWTKSQVLSQVCTFLGVDEKFDHTSAPRDDSRLVAATARIIGWSDDAIPADFVLPGWVGHEFAMRQALRPATSREDDAGSLPPLSRAETLEWFKHREFLISRGLGKQIEDDGWDGVIEAGKANVSVLDVVVGPTSPPRGVDGGLQQSGSENPREVFVRPLLEARGWSVLDWALQSSVAWKTADNYLRGAQSYASTRKKLAASLGIDVNELPE
jgi:hypothetical protein